MSDAPVINPAWLTTSADVEVAVAVFKRVREIWAQLAAFNPTDGPENYPGAAVQTDARILKKHSEAGQRLYGTGGDL